MKYKVIRAHKLDDLEAAVNDYLDEGWQLEQFWAGGTPLQMYIQTLTKPKARDGIKKVSRFEYPKEFEETWKIYPKRDGANPKKTAFNAWQARVKEGADPKDLYRRTRDYALWCEKGGRINTELVMQGQRFYGPNEDTDWKVAVEKVSLPRNNDELEAFARKHNLSPPMPGEEYSAYRVRLQKALDTQL
jgi:hypothetical protein